MQFGDLLKVTLSINGVELQPKKTLERQTWPSSVFNFGILPENSHPILKVGVIEEDTAYRFLQRDYDAQRNEKVGEVWRPVDVDPSGEASTVIRVEDGVTVGNTNNIQCLVFCPSSFCNLAITVQITPGGSTCVVVEKTWHGKIYRDKDGIRALDLERKGEPHPLLQYLQEEYASDELEAYPGDYSLWMEKIRFGRLHHDEVVVYAMNTPENGGTYYARDNNKKFTIIKSHQIIEGCPFPTVGTVLRKRGDAWDALPEQDCCRIFTGRLEYRPDKNARTRVGDFRKSASSRKRTTLENPVLK